jgi:hypothetical protein
VAECIDPWVAKTAVFAKPSPNRSLSMIEKEPFGLVFAKTGSINSDTGVNTAEASCFLIKRCLRVSAFFGKILRTVCAGLPV